MYGSEGQAVMQKAVTVKGQHRHAEEVAWLAMKRASSPQQDPARPQTSLHASSDWRRALKVPRFRGN